MKTIEHLYSVEECWQVAAKFAELLQPGMVLALHGDLGSGKTTFMQGVAAALGVHRAVTSPTFTLSNEYQTGSFKLVHMDLYRLAKVDDLDALGFNEHLESGAVVAVEWPERAAEFIPESAWHIYFEIGEELEERLVTITMKCALE